MAKKSKKRLFRGIHGKDWSCRVNKLRTRLQPLGSKPLWVENHLISKTPTHEDLTNNYFITNMHWQWSNEFNQSVPVFEYMNKKTGEKINTEDFKITFNKVKNYILDIAPETLITLNRNNT